jgi:putative FmdB family regulatory protein
MPLYDYKCHGCGKVFEVRQKFAEETLKVHDECGGELERLISVPALQFKGTGWYVTDYGKGGVLPSKDNGSNGKSESKAESKTEAKSEPKSESKTESKPAPAAPASDK